MSLLLPAALVGACVLAVPLAIHLLGRERPPVQRVPSLRFVDATPLVPRRRARLQDVGLMGLRMLILAIAVLALARPTRSAPEAPAATLATPRTTAAVPAIAVTIDDSASRARIVRPLRPAQLPAVAALLREPAVAYALQLGPADPSRSFPGVPVVVDHAGAVRLSAWADDTDTLRLATQLAPDAAARRLLTTVVAAGDLPRIGVESAADTTPVTVRRARDVHADTAPYARVLWGIVLLLLLLEWWWRRRMLPAREQTR
jgi:hypothetical protein